MQVLFFIVLVSCSLLSMDNDLRRSTIELPRTSQQDMPPRRHSHRHFTECNVCRIKLTPEIKKEIPCGHGCCVTCFEIAQDAHCTHCGRYFGDILGHHHSSR
jgi:hypothetical protein